MARSRMDYEPDQIRKLVAHLGNDHTQAAAAMGCHPSTVSKALTHEVTTQKQELRAAEALAKLHEDASRARQQAKEAVLVDAPQILVTVPQAKLEAFQKVAAVMGCELVAL